MAQVGGKSTNYDQTIQIICNLSDLNSQRAEKRSIENLLGQNVGGFRFHLYWDNEHSQLLYRRPDGEMHDFTPVIDEIGNYLEREPDKILTIFLDLDLPIDSLQKVFKEKDFLKYFHRQAKNKDWPTISEMLQSDRRIVLFTMEQIFNQPDWLHHIWNHAVEPYFSLFEAPNFLGEFLKGDPKNDLLIINDFNIPSNRLEKNPVYIIDQNTNHYLLNHCLTIWRNTGKAPNFIFLDQYSSRMQTIVNNLLSFNTISGRLTYNRETLDYVNWEGRENCQTSGKYIFPIVPGDRFTLKPSVPGLKFTPESVNYDEPASSIIQNFVANPLDITEGLVAFYPFENGAADESHSNKHGKPARVSFETDKIRGSVASFKGNSYIVLPKAEELKLRDHSFTISAWVKLARNDNRDNSILGTTVKSYQEGIHFTIREKRPYLGFYANDIQGYQEIEEGIWYHIVARYNKLNGEQAIFVNGVLDNKSLGHAAYQGKEEIIIGNASFGWRAFFNGEMDNLAIWERPLGDQEIFNLAMDVESITPPKPDKFDLMMILVIIGGLGIIIFTLVVVRRSRNKSTSIHNGVHKSFQPDITIPSGSFQLKDKNLIKLFGSFKILSRNGTDITAEFTPKIKSLFLAILLHSTKSKNGISTEELTAIVWPEHSFKSAKNSRGVTMRKLRVILEQLDKVEIEFKRDRWIVQLSDDAYCDYFECIQLLENPQFNNLEYYYRLFHIVEDGQIVKNENYEWMDDIKGYVDYRVIDLLLKYIGLLNDEKDADLILKIIDRIHISDPVNEKAVELKIKILLAQDNSNYARYCYDTFSRNFEDFYGQAYQKSFEEVVNLVK
jgi:DNA-binding SARP family transcriptional activator